MTKLELVRTLTQQFPQFPALDINVMAHTVAGLSLLELRLLKLSHQDNPVMSKVIDTAIAGKEREEADIARWEREHQVYDDYYHCGGKW
ncbi:MAG: hypothetical protein N5P05_004079 (plasmid) [Chroococcopsis gigantea SAG 12.99]|jgi:hypothetical protein|nr:hypothetical protein [Chroococcopsis gigantea SAG 12.99]